MPNPLYRFPLAYTQTPVGPFIYMPTDEYVGQALDKYGWYSPSESKFLQMLVQPGWKVANIGAQMGYMARVFANARCEVHAFEPQPGMYDVMRMNCFVQPPNRIAAYNAALGSDTKDIQVPHFDYSRKANFGSIDSSHWTRGNSIHQFTLDEWSKSAGVEYDCDGHQYDTQLEFDLIQIDAEGMELDILKGGEKLIRETRPILFVENDKPEKHEALLNYLHELDYICYWVVTPLFEYPNPADNKEDVFPGVCAFNMVCFPKKISNPHTLAMHDWCEANLKQVHMSDTAGHTDQYLILD